MAFTVGGGPDANSYVSVEYVDGYFADRNTAAWTGGTPEKQGALVRASDYVRAVFSNRFDPAKVDLDDLPDTLLKAVSEYGLVELVNPGSLAPNATTSVSTVVTKEKVGPLETTYAVLGGTDNAVAGARKAFPVADAYMAWLLLPSFGLTRTTR